MLIAFHKPFGVLSQFTGDASPNRALAEFGFPKNVYPIGRLDADSEGLLLFSDEAEWNDRLLHPRHAHEREYWAQVEGIPTWEALQKLAGGVVVQGRTTLPCRAWLLDPQPEIVGENSAPGFHPLAPPAAPARRRGGSGTGVSPVRIETHGRDARATTRFMETGRPRIPPRDPPIRFRKSVPDCWIGLALTEGRNRQVRRMTAAIGHPTLRLVRVRIGGLRLENLRAGEWKELSGGERQAVLR